MNIARKAGRFRASYPYMLYLAAVAFLCVGLVLLQHFCMDHRDGDFITSYCLTDSHMRAVLAAILTVVGLVLTSSVTSAVEAYRTCKLASGINEGVYIAMASYSSRYRLRALVTPWAPAVMLIILCTNAPDSIQTLANLGIKTAGVYVRNNSTAAVYDKYAFYNSSAAIEPPNLDFALGVLTGMRDFSTIAAVVHHDGGVSTSVVMDGYLGTVKVQRNDATNALKHLETVVTITSKCTSAPLMGPLSVAVPKSLGAVNLTLVSPTDHSAVAVVYEIGYAIPSNNSLLIHSSVSDVRCQSSNEADACTSIGPRTSVAGTTTMCISTAVVQDQDIIFTVGATSVTPVRLVSNVTTVVVSDLAELIVSYARSVEATPQGLSNANYGETVISQFSRFPTGSFETPQANVLHTKLCASSSLALNLLFTNYELNSPNLQVDAMTGNNGSAKPVPLYNIVQLTSISAANIAVITGVITGSTCLVCLVGMLFATTSLITVKPATDSSLLYNADPGLIARKQALMSELSNDPDRQLASEFRADSVLYCRRHAVSCPDPADATKDHTCCCVIVSYSNTQVSAEPELA